MIASSFAILAFILFSGSFVLFIAYPEWQRQQILVGFGAFALWLAQILIGYALIRTLPYSIRDRLWHGLAALSLWLVLVMALWFSQRIEGWRDWIGLGLALFVGVGLGMTELYTNLGNVDFTPVWVSVAFFPELFSRQVAWRSRLSGLLLWGVLIVLVIGFGKLIGSD